MKPFAIWLAAAVGLFGLLSGASHFYLGAHPARVAVAVDASFPMKNEWRKALEAIDALENRRYTVFALVTEKGRVHSWSPDLDMGRAAPYAPRDLSRLADTARFPELGEAHERILITNAPPDETASLSGWKIIRLGP